MLGVPTQPIHPMGDKQQNTIIPDTECYVTTPTYVDHICTHVDMYTWGWPLNRDSLVVGTLCLLSVLYPGTRGTLAQSQTGQLVAHCICAR